MAKKKSRRSRSTSQAEQVNVSKQVEQQAVAIPRRAVSDETFNPDYTPIIRDLKRIGSLAGIFFAVLIALSFIL